MESKSPGIPSCQGDRGLSKLGNPVGQECKEQRPRSLGGTHFLARCSRPRDFGGVGCSIVWSYERLHRPERRRKLTDCPFTEAGPHLVSRPDQNIAACSDDPPKGESCRRPIIGRISMGSRLAAATHFADATHRLAGFAQCSLLGRCRPMGGRLIAGLRRGRMFRDDRGLWLSDYCRIC